MPRVLVTGATDGIGKQTASDLAALGFEVILHGRSASKLQDTLSAIQAASPSARLSTLQADLASLADVRRLADDFHARFSSLDILLHNAGVFMNRLEKTPDGFETTFAVNHLAPFLLTHLLLPSLASSPSSRIILVSSIAHTRGKLDFDNLHAEKGFDGYSAYALSKLANVLFASEIPRRLGSSSSIAAFSLHPGVVGTRLLKEGFQIDGRDSLREGAATSVYLASTPDLPAPSGSYFVRKAPAAPHPLASNLDTCRRFYDLSATLTRVSPL